MKKLSSFFALFLTLSSLVLCSCSDDDNPNPLAGSNGVLDVSPAELSFGVDGGTASFTVNGGTAFVRSETDWLTVARVSGDSKKSEFAVTCAKNTGEERVGTVLANLNGAFARINVTQQGKFVKPDEEYSFRKAPELAKDMYPGWNLGNTLEASGSGLGAETSWQGTKTTQEIIDYVKAQGFKSVRIPCSWDIHATNGRIDAEWMARVKEVVDYCMNAGLYVVLNDHWDGGWIEVLGFSKSSDKYTPVDEETIAAKTTQLKNYWTQIANAFQNYDEHLLFAGLNEPFQQYDLFNNRHKELTPILNRYNQAFVDAVRATEGNNAKRTLVVQGPSTSTSSAVDPNMGFVMPTDTETGYIMAEVHYYEPWDFCGQEDNGTWFWGNGNHVSGNSHNATWGEEQWVKDQFAKLKNTFVNNGYPVIIGEYGAQWRTLSANQAEHDASVKTWFKEVNAQAVNNGLITFAWDINSPNTRGEQGTMTIINRSNLSIFCTPAMEGIKEGVAAGKWPN